MDLPIDIKFETIRDLDFNCLAYGSGRDSCRPTRVNFGTRYEMNAKCIFHFPDFFVFLSAR
jgi:hypothetical protein